MAEVDWLEKIKKREQELEPLYARMDIDRGLYYLEAFVLKDLQDNEVPNIRNITLNDPVTYADRVIGSMLGADPQTVVEGKGLKKLPDKKTTVVERFLKNYLLAANERLGNLGIAGGLEGALDSQMCIRGGMVARSAPHMDDDGEFAADLVPWDRRYVSFESGPKGLLWAAYRTVKSKGLCEQLYGFEPQGDTGKVLDLWTPEANLVYIDEELKKTEKHNFGVPPVIIEACPTGAFLRDEGWIAHDGESIYSAVRDLYEQLNQLATVLNTINMRSFQGSLQTQTEDPTSFDLPGGPFGERQLIPLKIGEEIKLVPLQDIKQATRYLLNMIESRIQRGSLAATEFGNLTFPLSAVAIKQLGEAKNNVLVPRLDGKARFDQRLARLIIRQWIAGGFKAELGPEGEEVAYSVADLAGAYTITYRYFPVSPMENIANYAIAGEASQYLDEETVLADVLHVQDPQGMIQKRRSEMADKMVPELQLLHMAQAKLAEGKKLEAAIIAGKMGMSLEQLKAGEVNEGQAMGGAQQGGGRQGKPLVDLFGTSRATPGAKSSQQEAAEMATNLEAG